MVAVVGPRIECSNRDLLEIVDRGKRLDVRCRAAVGVRDSAVVTSDDKRPGDTRKSAEEGTAPTR
jgi:hypothetical protein